MRHLARAAALSVLLASVAHAAPRALVRLGIDVLRDGGFKELAGKRVGLVVNPASVDSTMKPTVFVLRDARGVNLVSLASPEHGIWGEEYAGVVKPTTDAATLVDPTTGLTIFDVYKSATRTRAFLDGVDVVVFDIQDLGARSNTYLSTMKDLLQACAAQDKHFIILDRPNPLGGVRVEGSMVSDPKFSSFVSYLDVPYLHGMTLGEVALMTRDAIAPDYRKLKIVKMEGWGRDMTWIDTGLNWIMTSPHLPQVSSIAGYASTGIMGELYQVSNGVGYTLPFEAAGGPEVDGVALAERLNKLWPDAPGVTFRPLRFRPFYATNAGVTCQGVQIYVDPHTAPSLVEINYRIIEALDGPKIMAASTRPSTDAKKKPSKAGTPAHLAGTIDVGTRRPMFDKVTGSDDIGDALARGDDLEPVFAKWRAQCDAFKKKRAKYLLY